MKKFIATLVLSAFILFTPGGGLAQDKDYTPGKTQDNIIQDLRNLLSDTPEFAARIEKALQVQEKGSDWYGKDLNYFVRYFEQWLTYNPVPADPSKYIVPFDYLANSPAGKILFNDNIFSSWFIAFLDARGKYLDTPESAAIMFQWMKAPVIKWEDFIIPDPTLPGGGFLSFHEFFLRGLAKDVRPLKGANGTPVLVSPADGMACQVFAQNLETSFKIKRDEINIRQALNNSQYAEKFVGGPVLDTLLWFTDYHHFHAPVTGTIVEVSEYAGSYNYNFADVNWYKDLAKHKRTCYIIDSPEVGLVAMIPVGFWGVGSIVTVPEILEKGNQIVLNPENPGKHKVVGGYPITIGQHMGHFKYGGSSILLVFEPGRIKYSQPFPVYNSGDGGFPVQVRAEIGVPVK